MTWKQLAVCLVLAFSTFCFGQTPPSVTSIEVGSDTDTEPVHRREKVAHKRALQKKVYRWRVGEVKVEGRWSGEMPLPLKKGDVLTPEKLFAAMEAIEAAVTAETIQGYGLRSQGEMGVLYIDVDFATNAPAGRHTVDVTFRPYYVHFSLVKMGDNVLPIPRSARPTFYENVPGPLLALKPTLGISYDRAFGTSLGGALEADLLNLSNPARSSAAPESNRHLDLNLQGEKSLEEIFYRADAGVRYHVRRDGETFQEFNFRGDYDGTREPLGEREHTRQAGLAGAGLTLKVAANTRLSLDTGYRRATDDLKDGLATTRTSTDEQVNRALFDSIPRPFYGFLRAAVWEDNGWQSGRAGSYQRLAARVGYAKEISLSPNQTLGLELVAGGGKAWGNIPEHARFFGGNSEGQFLYDSPSSASLLNMPAGPILRSFGEGQAGLRASRGGVRGGDAFWHVNLNLTFPIRFFSRALIPDEVTDLEDADGNPTTLKQMLRRQIDVTGPSMLAATLRKEGLSESAANQKANQILGEIQPATHYLIDDANLYALKPMFMLDAAGLSGGGAGQTWLAAGGGLQLTLVTARFEVGYMHTLSGPAWGRRGNIFFRLVFQNLF